MLYHLMSNQPTQSLHNQKTAKGAATRGAIQKHSRGAQCNIYENENEWTLDLLVPGYAKSNFSMEVNEGVLKISGTKEHTGRKIIKKEFGSNQIERSFTLPKNASLEKVSATLEAGILSIVIPKNEQAKLKTITIK